MLNYATDICNKEALKNQRRDFVSNILHSARQKNGSCLDQHSRGASGQPWAAFEKSSRPV
jgi:hypothetical protein